MMRTAWLAPHVLACPCKAMRDGDLERFSRYSGPVGEDPFIASIDGREHIIAVQRSAVESAPIFAEAWHSDWSFQRTPPAATCLYGITIPPRGAIPDLSTSSGPLVKCQPNCAASSKVTLLSTWPRRRMHRTACAVMVMQAATKMRGSYAGHC